MVCGWWLLGSVSLGQTADDEADRSRLEQLRGQIAHHDELYFRQAASEITDAEYDRLKRELAELQRAHPDWTSPEAPHDERTGRLPTHAHGRRMLSLDKAYTEEEWRAFHANVLRRLGRSAVTFVIEPKYDGVAVSLVYEQGRLVRALTRGNGREGDDVTANVRRIAGLRAELRDGAEQGRPNPLPERVELRGEIYIDAVEFARLNALKEVAGEEPFVHPRNLAAGTLLAADADEAESRRLSLVIYGWGDWRGPGEPASQQAFHAQVWAWGLPGVPRFRAVRSAEEGWEAVQELRRDRPRLGFPIDGAVAKLDDVAARASLGESERAPRWAIACKYEPERAVARVRSITIQVGRTGLLTPVAELDPVELGGARVTRATLHNRSVIARRDIRVGDFVEVERAGDVIPAVAGIRVDLRPPGTQAYSFPSHCPACGEPVALNAGEAITRCVNSRCPGQLQRRLEHFASADAVNISGLGPAAVAALLRAGLVGMPADLYRLRREDLDGVEGLGPASAERLIAGIERSRQAELWRFLYGLGIPRVGVVSARKLAGACGSLDAFGAWDEARFAAIVGAVSGRSIARYLSAEANRTNLRALIENGVRPASSQLPPRIPKLQGKIVVFTGTLPDQTRTQAAEQVRLAGGIVRDEVTAAASFVVAGEGAGRKLDDAHKLGIRVLSAADFAQLFAD